MRNRGALSKDRRLGLAHSFLREAQGAAAAELGTGTAIGPIRIARRRSLGLIDGAQQLGFSLSEIPHGVERSRAQFSLTRSARQSVAKQTQSHRPAHKRSTIPAASDCEAAQGNGTIEREATAGRNQNQISRVMAADMPVRPLETDRYARKSDLLCARPDRHRPGGGAVGIRRAWPAPP